MRLFSRAQPSRPPTTPFVDFRTDTIAHGQRARGVGVYEGRIPTQVDRVLFDGTLVNFRSPETVAKVFRAAQGVETLRGHGTTGDCFAFTALFSETVQIEQIPKKAEHWLDLAVEDVRIEPDDIIDGQTVAIGAQYHDMNGPIIYHGLVAAETDNSMMFFHVLGDDGPLALSGLNQALEVFKSTHIRNFSRLKVAE